MPIVRIRIVGTTDNLPDRGVTQNLADAAGEVLGSRLGGTWVQLETLPPEQYAESGGPTSARPVFVEVLKRAVDPSTLKREARALAEAVAAQLSWPVEHVHIIYEAPAAGRVAFGGELLP